MTGKGRRSFSTAAMTRPSAEQDVPTSRSVPVELVAPNPVNARRIDPDSQQIRELAASIEAHTQLEPSVVVTRDAFLAVFGEYADTIGPVIHVQVTGGQRRAACAVLGRELEILVKDELAESRERFVAATVEENLARNAYNAVEEAQAVALLVVEAGNNQTKAAERLRKSQPWVSQRLSLLKLGNKVQDLLRDNPDISVREIRSSLHRETPDVQLAVVQRLISAKNAVITAVITEPDTPPVPRQAERVPRAVATARKLAATPPDRLSELGVAMRAEMPLDLRKMWAAELLRED